MWIKLNISGCCAINCNAKINVVVSFILPRLILVMGSKKENLYFPIDIIHLLNSPFTFLID